ncbi:MAG TPA: trypsin-like peptidase domain-containing protein [Actinomycetes bacterium]
MGDQSIQPLSASSRRPPALRVVGVAVLVAIVAAVATSAWVLKDERRQLAVTRQQVAELQRVQAGDRAQLAGLSAQLHTAQQQLVQQQTRLKADEQQLDLTAQKLPPDLVTLAAKVSPSVVLITCASGTDVSFGTGFALDIPAAAGYQTAIVTAEHVIAACTGPTAGPSLSLSQGQQTLPAHLRAFDASTDVAIIDTTTKVPTLEPGGAPLVGQFVMVVGNPLGLANNVTSGNVSQVNANDFLNSAPTSSGNSGGPVVDRSGRVQGIVDAAYSATAGSPVVENLNVALRLSALCTSLLTSSTSCARLH